MMTVFEHLRKGLLERAGLGELPKRTDIRQRYQTEWSPRFEQYMRNRLVMGSLRYETFADKRKKPGMYDYVKEMKRRIKAYEDSGNTEFLVDVANMALLEFEFPFRPGAYFDNENEHNIHAVKLK